jgi:5-methylthioadenosine/S-adenosylhomocysteine deaminase
VPLNDPLLHVVFCEDGTGVDRVMIGGKLVVEGGRVIGVDMVKLASQASETVQRLNKTNAGARDFVQALEPVVLDYCVGLAREPYPVHRWCGTGAHGHAH